MQPLHLLLVEDNALDAELTIAQLERADYAVEAQVVYDAADFVARTRGAALRRDPRRLRDAELLRHRGADDRERARAGYAVHLRVGLLGEEHAVEMLKRGATDYVLKQRLQRLPAVVRRAMRESAERAQRIAVERALRETETHFRLLIDALKDYAVITLDPEGRIRTWNAASERILGFPAQDVLGQSASIFYAQEDRDAGVFEDELETARREGSASDDRWLWRKDGHSFFASGVTTAIRSEHRRADRLLEDRARRDRRPHGRRRAASREGSGRDRRIARRTIFSRCCRTNCARRSRRSSRPCACWR